MPALKPATRSKLAFALALLGVALGLELLRYTALPPAKPLGQPVYGLGPKAWAQALALGQARALRGPGLLGLVPGQRVFAKPEEAAAWRAEKGWDKEKWSVYLLDADWPVDTAQHGAKRRLNKNVRVLMAVFPKDQP